MAQNPQKRQRALARKASKHKAKKAAQRSQSQAAIPDRHAQIRAAGAWPLLETLLTQGWEEPGALVQALVARQSPAGRIAVAAFLIDLGCLGVKSAFVNFYPSESDYRYQLRRGFVSRQPMTKADTNLIAKIVREGVAYAQGLGFRPDPDYRDALLLLGDADPNASPAKIPLGGEDGKPLFVAGPHDNVDAIMATLTRKLGPEGFHFIVPVGLDASGLGYALESDEDWEDEDEEEE